MKLKDYSYDYNFMNNVYPPFRNSFRNACIRYSVLVIGYSVSEVNLRSLVALIDFDNHYISYIVSLDILCSS